MNIFVKGAFALLALSALCTELGAQPLNALRAANDISGAPALGARLTRHWINAPEAVCNDGSPAAAYVRRAGTQANRDRWIIYLQGGGSCDNDQDCLDRWQSFDNNYGLQKMSSSIPAATWNGWYPGAGAPSGWTLQGANYAVPVSIAPQGLFSSAAANPFADWNQVFVHYCSSDQWLGQKPLHVATAVDQIGIPPQAAGTVQSYDIAFQGAEIFDGLINDLRSGVAYCLGQNCQTLPDLDDARFILLAGSSAGANGVKHQLDRLRAEQRAIRPDSEVRGLIDAAGSPNPAALPWPTSPAPFTDAEQRNQLLWDETFVGLWNARVDASCLVENVGVEARCGDSGHVLRHHISAPFFHRMDLQDSLALRPYEELFFPSASYGPNVGRWKLADGVARQLLEIGDALTWLTPRYANEFATIAADPDWIAPGIFGPRCGDHVGLLGNRTFLNQELPSPAGPVNFADALFNWVTLAAGGIGGAAQPPLIESVGVGAAGIAPCN
jgi:hypothetical protein